MADGKWQMANGRWQMADGKWQMANGRWQMADGRWQRLWQIAKVEGGLSNTDLSNFNNWCGMANVTRLNRRKGGAFRPKSVKGFYLLYQILKPGWFAEIASCAKCVSLVYVQLK